MSTRLPVELIRAKRDGATLTDAELRGFVAGVTDGSLPDYQIAAMLMAIFFRGLDDRTSWRRGPTRCCAPATCSICRRSRRRRSTSTRPAASATRSRSRWRRRSRRAASRCRWCRGAASATPGTLDKLESIPGFRGDLSIADYRRLVKDLGCCLIGQTATLAPADKKLYALRDVIATVD